MCYLCYRNIALINKQRCPANRQDFAVLLCFLRGPRFVPDKKNSPLCGVVSSLASKLKPFVPWQDIFFLTKYKLSFFFQSLKHLKRGSGQYCI
ncbi:DUF4158 domain-containing protein [Escherichia coli]|nr:DUF4158 domain-containing protein [Escherichia coli]EIC6110406.1 DUF4158 domain-containing protein [Escherichia coli]EIX0013395.1 DUF4158 domain-containing protein [Escherichia coli]EJS8686867.1 DUF4158 domain-containing protein [Escherichia coli]KAE9787761.1 DUF4158 domain-containing protein [Escherichia coli]